jgi:hypothetical protein
VVVVVVVVVVVGGAAAAAAAAAGAFMLYSRRVSSRFPPLSRMVNIRARCLSRHFFCTTQQRTGTSTSTSRDGSMQRRCCIMVVSVVQPLTHSLTHSLTRSQAVFFFSKTCTTARRDFVELFCVAIVIVIVVVVVVVAKCILLHVVSLCERALQ